MNPSLSTRVWKAGLLIFVGVVFALDLAAVLTHADFFTTAREGDLGATWGPRTGRQVPIVELKSDGPLATAGAHVGDAVEWDYQGDIVRHFRVGETIGLTLHRSGEPSRHIDVHAAEGDPVDHAAFAFVVVVNFLMLFSGALVGWRGADSVPLRLLSASLVARTMSTFIFSGPGGTFHSAVFVTFWTWSFFAVYVSFLCFAVQYAVPNAARRPAVVAALYAFIALFAAYASIGMLGFVSQTIGSWSTLLIRRMGIALALISGGLSLMCLLIGWVRSIGEKRQRLAWLSLCLGCTYAVYVYNNVYLAFGIPFSVWIGHVEGVILAVANLGFVYAVLRKRVLDVGFALNRAVVYGATSLVLAAAFILLGQITNRLIHFEEREHDRFVDIAVGLLIALMARQIVKWVDPRVQRIFFRRWHATTARLVRLQTAAVDRAAPQHLEVELLDAVLEYANAKCCALYRRDRNGDLTFVRHVGAHPTLPRAEVLATIDRQLDGGARSAQVDELDAAPPTAHVAFPMRVHGELLGAVVVSDEPLQRSYTPADITLIAASVMHVGVQLELVRLKTLEAGAAARPT